MCESNGHRVVFIKMTLAPSQAKQDKQCRKVQRREQPPLPRPLPFTIPASRGQDFLLLCSLLSSQHLGLPGTEPTLSRDHHPTLTFGASRLCTENFGEMKSYGEEVHRDIHVSLRAVSLLLETRRLGVGCAAVLPGPPCAASPPQALRISSCHSGTVSSVCLFMSYSHELFSVRKQQVSGKLPSILAPVRTQLGPSWHFLPAPGPQQATSPRQFFPARPYPGRHLHSDLLPTRAQEPVGLPSEVQFEVQHITRVNEDSMFYGSLSLHEYFQLLRNQAAFTPNINPTPSVPLLLDGLIRGEASSATNGQCRRLPVTPGWPTCRYSQRRHVTRVQLS
ncbi:uncharacterized protein [Manis javanica]|uniref:uncharacterized protein isoform X1 n=1 Tax=Manis javanica TaxID=9974 RepID=UPI003C6D1AA0